MTMIRRDFIHKAGIGAAALTTASLGWSEAASPPNVLLILVDDLGYGDLSSYGALDVQSPHIDSLVSSGIRFNRFYANCPVCSPTRASLLTGRYPERVGVPGVIRTHADNNWGYLAPNAVMLPQILSTANYHTALVGKWHLGLEPENAPRARGFDHFAGFLGDMMDDYYDHRRHGINYMRLNEEEIDPEGHATDVFSDWAVEYIQERENQENPFFLFLSYNAPHTPIQPPTGWVERVRARHPEMPETRANLVALIEHMDDGIGRVIDALKRTGAYENTVIFFTSDNGGQLNVGADNGNLRGGKQEMYEGGLRVPFCAVWPQWIQPGSESDEVAMTMDLFATIGEIASADISPDMDGRSILPTLLGRNEPYPERDLFWIRREGGNRYMGQTIWAARRGDWKLLQNLPTEPYRLYNLADDPLEEHDRAGDSPQVFNELATALRAHVQRGGAVPWQKTGG